MKAKQTFSDKQKLREFVVSRLALRNIKENASERELVTPDSNLNLYEKTKRTNKGHYVSKYKRQYN